MRKRIGGGGGERGGGERRSLASTEAAVASVPHQVFFSWKSCLPPSSAVFIWLNVTYLFVLHLCVNKHYTVGCSIWSECRGAWQMMIEVDYNGGEKARWWWREGRWWWWLKGVTMTLHWVLLPYLSFSYEKGKREKLPIDIILSLTPAIHSNYCKSVRYGNPPS